MERWWDGLINVKVNVFYENDYKRDNSISEDIDLLEERGKNSFQKFVYIALIDNKKGNFRQKLPLGNQDIQIDLNRSHVRRKSPYWYSRKALGVIYRYIVWINPRRRWKERNMGSRRGKAILRSGTAWRMQILILGQ